MLPEDSNTHLLNEVGSLLCKLFWLIRGMFCFYTYSTKCPLLRFFSLQLSPVLKNPYSPTPAQPTTQTTRLPSPSQSRRQLYPAYLCRNNRWKRGRRGRRRERKWGKRCQQRRGRSWRRRGRRVTSQKPRVRARHVWCAARVVTLTQSSRKGGRETRSLCKKEEASAVATNPGHLTWGNHMQVWNSCKNTSR